MKTITEKVKQVDLSLEKANSIHQSTLKDASFGTRETEYFVNQDNRPESITRKKLQGVLINRKQNQTANQLKGQINTVPIQLRSGTLSVNTGSHDGSANQVPDYAAYNVGFIMDVSLDIDEDFNFNSLQGNFELTQYVRDEYDFWNESESILSQDLSDWERDQYGQENDKGDWFSDGNSTTWQDAPGWNGRYTITPGYLLSEYAVEFYFTIGDRNGGILHTSNEIRLLADSDNAGNITYTTANINDNIDYDP